MALRRDEDFAQETIKGEWIGEVGRRGRTAGLIVNDDVEAGRPEICTALVGLDRSGGAHRLWPRRLDARS